MNMSLKLSTLIIAVVGCIAGDIKLSNAGAVPLAVSVVKITDHVKAGQAVTMVIKMQNISRRVVKLQEYEFNRKAEADYFIDVRDLSGKEISLTAYGKEIVGPEGTPVAGVYRMVDLQPGASLYEEAMPNQIYEMTHPGTYVIHVVRQLPPSLGGMQIESSPVTVTVTE
jgi:hypothetical protein